MSATGPTPRFLGVYSRTSADPWSDRRKSSVPRQLRRRLSGTLPERVRNGRIECSGSMMSHGGLHGSASLQRPLSKAGPCSLDLWEHQTLAGLTGSWASHRLLFLFAYAHASGFSGAPAARTGRWLIASRIWLTGSLSALRFPIPADLDILGSLLILSSGLLGLLGTALWLHPRHLRLAGRLRLLFSERGN